MQERRFYKPALILLAVLLLGLSGWSQRHLNAGRAELGLTASKPLENAPPVLAFTTVALGGFRGIIANILWVRAQQLQIEGKYFELIQLSDWITKLQPRNVMVWRFQAWNLAYNVPVKFPDVNDRWPWVKRGLELLRDEALVWNPRQIELYQEIGVIYQHKLGGNSDDAHMQYKYELARMMEEAFGGPKPRFDELINPQTDDARKRAARLKEELKLDPVVMKEVDERYGPLEWRLPETHAIYWSVVGIKKASQAEKLILRRTIYQSMQLAVQRGQMIIYRLDENRNGIEFAPNIEMIENANRVYMETMEQEAKLSGEGVREHIGTGHRNFLNRAIFDLYMNNRRSAAEKWYQYMIKLYPYETDDSVSMEDYVVNRFVEEIGYDKPDQINASRDRVKAMVQGLVRQYFHYLAIGQDDMAIARDNYAKRIWMAHYEKIADPKIQSIVNRLFIEPVDQIKQDVLKSILDPQNPELTPYQQAVLLTRLGLTAAPTNQAPGSVIAPKSSEPKPGTKEAPKTKAKK